MQRRLRSRVSLADQRGLRRGGPARARPGLPKAEAGRWCRARGAAQRRRLDQIRLNSAAQRTCGDRAVTSDASRTAGLFVPKPSTDSDCQHRSTRGLRQTVRVCPLAYTVVGGDCHSLRHSVARESVMGGCVLHTLSKSAPLGPAQVTNVRDLGRFVLRDANRTMLDVGE